jgi:ribonuclease P protein component
MSNNCGFNRYAVVTSTKIDTRATKRNLLRRKIYSLLVNYPGSSDIILYPTSQVLNFDHAKISTLLDQLLPKTSSSLP